MEIFSWCGQVTGHFPKAGWLRPDCSFLKRMVSERKWDEKIDKTSMNILNDITKRLDAHDPVGGVWDIPKTKKGRVWCDACSLAIGVCLELNHSIVEDNCWLRKKDDICHINLEELEESVERGERGISMGCEGN